MNIQETNCVICGKKITDRSTNHARKYCSESCSYQGWRIRNGLQAKKPAFLCVHNNYVECQIHNCRTCGWNPEVAQKRLDAFAMEVETDGKE